MCYNKINIFSHSAFEGARGAEMERYAVLGHRIGHSMSPFLHGRLFELAGRKAEYQKLDWPAEEIGRRIGELFALDGFNVTMPHKVEIIPFLDELDASAAKYQSVNVVRCGAKKVGFNTDAYGFLKSLEMLGAKTDGRTLLLGLGGVGRTFARECLDAGADLTVTVLPGDRQAEAAAGELRARSGRDFCLTTLDRAEGHFDLMINATPVGMFPKTGQSPAGEELIARTDRVFDAVYNPEHTLLSRLCEQAGKPCLTGMPMLVFQAVKAHEIWYGAEFSPEQIRTVIRDCNEFMGAHFSA